MIRSQMFKSLTLSALAAAGILGVTMASVSARADQEGTKPVALSKADKAAKDDKDNCFYSNAVERYYPIDDNHIEITDYRGRSFAIEVIGACFGLEETMRLGFRSRSGSSRVCGAFDADVVYHDSSSGRMRSCNISSVTRINKTDTPAPVADQSAH